VSERAVSRIVAIGETERLRGFAFTGVEVIEAEGPAAARAAWQAVAPDVALVILTPDARAALAGDDLDPVGQRLWAVMTK
jgi:vacuolar-type H+-ATPase subunit F/Vma7